VPHTSAADIARLSPDLVANMVSFQEMTDAQVKQYATIAATANCPLLYSLNRERSAYNNELDSVSEALSTCYDLTEVQVLGTDYTAAMKKPPSPKKPVERTELNYRHLVGRLASAAATTGPRVVLGMTLHNNAPNLRKAMDSLLAQTSRDFALVMLDDASEDETEAIAREYEARDARVRYFRHAARKAMIATWHEVVEIASREYPSAEYFAWVSDHDQWHPQWLARLRSELDNDRDAVLAYPITRRIDVEGDELDKGPRLFDTAGRTDRRDRWKQWCHSGVGAGDMVYGLMRLDALRRAGIFRRVLRPDRLLIAELTLQGSFRQVPEALWFRRQSHASSVDRQRHTLVLAGDEPPWFGAPPWLQHSAVLWREYARPDPRPIAISRARWVGMLLRYQLTYGWRHFRKTETSHSIGRGIDNVVWSKKQVKHYGRLAVFHTLVGSRKAWSQARRGTRRAVYETLMLTHRLGLRGPGKSQ
jgi:glycosyltransferase involved in cell wall biosynthesis